MSRNPVHEMLPRANPEERARQRFVLALKGHLGRRLRPRLRDVYERDVRPALSEEDAGNPARISDAMYAHPHYRTWSSLNRCAQELMWEAIGETVFREGSRLADRYRALAAERPAGGSVALDPALEPPKTMARVNVHLQPGGYLRDAGEDDVLAGAFYESGGALYSMGQSVGTRESKAQVVQRFVRERYPDFTPTRILDMACSAGSSSTPWALAFPDAEVHATDIGAGMLRYAHARAEELGARVHFHQRRVEATGFDDASFDLVVSHNAMHEMSQQTQAAMMAESYRLLRTGGICVHQDVPLRFESLDAFDRFERSWDLHNNNEPFWEAYATNDPRRMLVDAGFAPDDVFVDMVPQLDGSIAWFVAAARKR